MRLETRLHRARIARGIDLSDVAARTRLSPHVVKKIDEGRFAELPPGIYARSYVRSFAAAVGLTPDEVVQELETVLPPVDDPLDGLREAARQSTAAAGSLKKRAAQGAAAVVDAGVLLMINAGLIQLTAGTCGVEAAALLEQAGAVVSVFCAVPVALYFLVFGGVGGGTPGARLCRVARPAPRVPLRLDTILTRAVSL